MSDRINYSEDEYFPGQFALWQANCKRSLKGREGQKSLRELEAALLALPTKRLLADEFDNGVDCCAIGALARQKGIEVDPDEAESEMEEVGVACGMPRLVAWKVVEVNDNGFSHVTPEERYNRMLAWVRKRITEDAA